MSYRAPVTDMMFVLRELAGLHDIAALPAFADADADTVESILTEAARFSAEVLAPLNVVGDREHSRWKDGAVTTPTGFRDAFKAFTAAGWQALQHPEHVGGQGLPKVVAAACMEMQNSANLSFSLCPLLTDGAIEALLTAGTAGLQQTYIPPMLDGRWTGTMNLTEPQAGSDLAMVRTRAEPQPDGTYRLKGQKIFITYGEHDMAENIVHLVLARVAGAPEGIRGISLFVVPKFLVGADGAPGARNDVYCASIEHKLGICGSPTAVLLFGEGQAGGQAAGGPAGAVGHLVGEENRGLEYMFIMMNAARFAVGMQGIAVSERAYQQAVAHARERIQSRAVEGSKGPVPIIHHPDVRRMLMTMRALTEGARAMAYVGAAALDRAHAGAGAAHGSAGAQPAGAASPQAGGAAVRAGDAATASATGTGPDDGLDDQTFHEFLVPLIKGYSTENSVEVASLGIQVHGGMGFIEETGAAQYLRDARILPIYEGTTAIQANDLLGRKTLRDGGTVACAVLGRVRLALTDIDTAIETARQDGAARPADADALASIRARLDAAVESVQSSLDHLVATGRADPQAAYAGSVPYLMQFGTLVAGWQMARAAVAAVRALAEGRDPAFHEAKLATARFHAEHLLPRVHGLEAQITGGAQSVMALDEAAF